MTDKPAVTVTNFRRSSIDGCERGVDANIAVTRGNRIIEGEITLLPAIDGRDRYETFGSSVDYWLSAQTELTAEEIKAVREAVEAAAPRPSEGED